MTRCDLSICGDEDDVQQLLSVYCPQLSHPRGVPQCLQRKHSFLHWNVLEEARGHPLKESMFLSQRIRAEEVVVEDGGYQETQALSWKIH